MSTRIEHPCCGRPNPGPHRLACRNLHNELDRVHERLFQADAVIHSAWTSHIAGDAKAAFDMLNRYQAPEGGTVSTEGTSSDAAARPSVDIEHDEWCPINGCRCRNCGPCLGPPLCVAATTPGQPAGKSEGLEDAGPLPCGSSPRRQIVFAGDIKALVAALNRAARRGAKHGRGPR